jgi:nitrite reductase/ring-hydroxylating ferredoxin subunit
MDWIKIFSTQEELEKALTPDRPRLLILRGIRICLVYHEGMLRAVEDACPHNGESLSKGIVNYLGEIVCPWHGQQFDLKNGRECSERSRDLIVYPVKTDEAGVFIGL